MTHSNNQQAVQKNYLTWDACSEAWKINSQKNLPEQLKM